MSDLSIHSSEGTLPLTPNHSVDGQPTDLETKTGDVACSALQCLKDVLCQIGLMLIKFIAIPIEAALLTVAALAWAVVSIGGPSRAQRYVTGVVIDLASIIGITAMYGSRCGSPRLQPADENDPEGAKLVLHEPEITAENAAPILYAPGYLDNPETLKGTCQELANATGRRVYVVQYRSLFQSIEEHAQDVNAVAQRIFRDMPNKRLVLIGHSMGGLTTGEYLTNVKPDDVIVEHWSTIGSPMDGTWKAYLGIGQCARQMEPHSEFAQALSARLANKTTPSSHFYSDADSVVPAESAQRHENNSTNYRSETAFGHLSIRSSRFVIDNITHILQPVTV